jgi:phosphoglycolate phosphatase-like HAD superfamily hydrolase
MALAGGRVRGDDPLPSWNEGPTKQAIVDFVTRVTTAGGPDYVPPELRIATFDNDGTLWAEQPIYFQFAFAFDRIKQLAPEHPEWKETEPFKSVFAGDLKGALAGGEQAAEELLVATHSGITTDKFNEAVRNWLRTARHPRFDRPYNELVYQPMLELLAYLRAQGFETFIVSGGGIEFMRVWAEQAYGIPPPQIVGSTGKLKYESRDGRPELVKLPDIAFIDDGPGKPAGIENHIGRQPIAAFGNSDGDFEMLEWTTAGHAERHPLRLGMIVHHTDAEREWAYDSPSPVGQLKRALADAPQRGWVVIDMKRDWKTVFPFQK